MGKIYIFHKPRFCMKKEPAAGTGKKLDEDEEEFEEGDEDGEEFLEDFFEDAD